MRKLLEREGTLVLPGCHDALGARIMDAIRHERSWVAFKDRLATDEQYQDLVGLNDWVELGKPAISNK